MCTGKAFISAEINIERISREQEIRARSNTCVFTFVDIDVRIKPQPIPQTYATTYAKDERYLKSGQRRKEYKEMDEIISINH